MSETDNTARQSKAVTIERWEYDNPSWVVVAHHPVVTTALDGKPVGEMVVEVQHRETGAGVSGAGADLTLALAMVTHRLSERF